MHITLSPSYSGEPLTLAREGSALIINGERFDFGPLKEGDVLPRADVACDMLESDVTRIDGVLHLTLRLPYGEGAPQETRFPEPLLVTQDGDIALPPYTAPTEQLT